MEKHTKTTEYHGKKQVEASKVLKPDVQQLTIKNVILKGHLNKEAKNEIERIKDIEKMVNREDLILI